MQNFDPFLDWEAIDEEIASDINKHVKRHRRLMEQFALMKRGDPGFVEAARELMQQQHKTTTLMGQVMHHIYTVPAMVHIAGERKWEDNLDDNTEQGLIQRCARCGSPLGFFSEGMMVIDEDSGQPRPLVEEDVPWFTVGETIGKIDRDEGMTMYAIEGRELFKHERECVALNDLMGLE